MVGLPRGVKAAAGAIRRDVLRQLFFILEGLASAETRVPHEIGKYWEASIARGRSCCHGCSCRCEERLGRVDLSMGER